jgi:hypothetical protein
MNTEQPSATRDHLFISYRRDDARGASGAFTAALRLAKSRRAGDPANTQWQRDLSVSHNKIGDVLLAQGDRPASLAAYRQSLAIREALAGRDPCQRAMASRRGCIVYKTRRIRRWARR